MRSRMSCAISMALYREPPNVRLLKDVAKGDSPNLFTGVYPEFVLLVVQDVSLRLVVDDHEAVVRGSDDDGHVPIVLLDSCENRRCCLVEVGEVVLIERQQVGFHAGFGFSDE